MNEKQFTRKLNQLKKAFPKHDYHIDLYYNGVRVGCIYPDCHYDEIGVEDRDGYVLVYDDTFGVFVDKAELRSI